MTTSLIPRRLRPSQSRPTVLLKVDTSVVHDPGKFLREVGSQVRKAGFRALVVEADGPIEVLGAATDQFLRHTYGTDPTPSLWAKLIEDWTTPVGYFAGDDSDALGPTPGTMWQLPDVPDLRPGAHARITQTLAQGCLGTLIGPESVRVAGGGDPVEGWWIRLDAQPDGPFANVLGWYALSSFEVVDWKFGPAGCVPVPPVEDGT